MVLDYSVEGLSFDGIYQFLTVIASRTLTTPRREGILLCCLLEALQLSFFRLGLAHLKLIFMYAARSG